MNDQVLLIGCIFGAVTLTGYFLTLVVVNGKDAKLRDRLNGPAVDDVKTSGRLEIGHFLQRFGEVAAQPFMPTDREKVGKLRSDLAKAGKYAPNAVKLFNGGKAICLGLGLLIGYLVVNAMDMPMILGISLGGLAGYMTPTMWLKWAIKDNHKHLQYGLADALDLMVVCVEAGLTVDAAMQRVGTELMLAHPAISRELGICHMETRVGLSRAEAMKNLGLRTGSEPLQALSAMLIQADRFGTSIANALRIQAESLRMKRQHAAEELAAKASVKMSFPLVLFIFPATFIVLAGPVVLDVMNSEIMK
jgi:tight adherence protein C